MEEVLAAPAIRLPQLPSTGVPVSASKRNQSKSVTKISKISDQDNPFRLPTYNEIFSVPETRVPSNSPDTVKKKRPGLYSPKYNKRPNVKNLIAEQDPETEKLLDKLKMRSDADVMLMSQQGTNRRLAKDNLHDFVAKKREMFLLEYALGVKKEEIQKLEQIAQKEENRLLEDERALENDATKFDAFLKENDKNSVDAIKRAEIETKAKLDKVAEIKKLNLQLLAIRSDMSKNEDQLKDYQRYYDFLMKLTPQDWLDQYQKTQVTKKRSADATKRMKTAISKTIHSNSKSKSKYQQSSNRIKNESNTTKTESSGPSQSIAEGSLDKSLNTDNNTDTAETPFVYPLYFTTPFQLLDIFSELEQNNLTLIQNCQETEETLDKLKSVIHETEDRMGLETQSLRDQIEYLQKAIKAEEDKAAELEGKAKYFTSTLSETDQEKILNELNTKVKDVYQRCLGDTDGNVSTLQMLTGIENKLENLFESLELMPPDKVLKAERIKDKERRQRLRTEKMDAQRLLQEERIQRALERAKAPGKPVVFRSVPLQKKKKMAMNDKNKDEEDLAYYWE